MEGHSPLRGLQMLSTSRGGVGCQAGWGPMDGGGESGGGGRGLGAGGTLEIN